MTVESMHLIPASAFDHLQQRALQWPVWTEHYTQPCSERASQRCTRVLYRTGAAITVHHSDHTTGSTDQSLPFTPCYSAENSISRRNVALDRLRTEPSDLIDIGSPKYLWMLCSRKKASKNHCFARLGAILGPPTLYCMQGDSYSHGSPGGDSLSNLKRVQHLALSSRVSTQSLKM